MTSCVALDTNIVLLALRFSTGRLAWLRPAWQERPVTPLICRETAQELLRMPAYPKFKLSAEEQQVAGGFPVLGGSGSSG